MKNETETISQRNYIKMSYTSTHHYETTERSSTDIQTEMFWRRLPVLCILLMCIVFECGSSPLGQRGTLAFTNSLRLTRTVRARVQQLLLRYKQQLFGDQFFEYRELMLSTLPAVTVSYQTWLQMQDIERLRLASHHLQTFWTHLEDQRQQLEKEKDEKRKEQRRDKRGRPPATLCQSFMGLQTDLRDLMRQVNSQLMSLTTKEDPGSTSTKFPLSSPTPTSNPIPSMHGSTVSTTLLISSKLQSPFHTNTPQSSTNFITSTQTSTASNMKLPNGGLTANTERTFVGVTTTPRPTKPTQTSTVLYPRGNKLPVGKQQTAALSSGTSRWVQHLKGYVILRDLERYLSRLARDYTVLQAKH